ncbi:EFR1 family ferrodoxin [Alloiococcus sp. CFN-8]|uniref:EFR1 family ferrodoxin n=1 Tax=Alloiococcus sp. CFN-8 TaxID=3416081 RepID=UPI003CEFFC10
MILYFTGTGNSYYAAKRISEEINEELVSISLLMEKNEVAIELQEGESLGFVFPVYYYGIPSIVKEFVEKLELKGYKNNYIFTVITCGGTIEGAGGQLKELLSGKGYTLDFLQPLLMPDNYVLMYNVPSKEKTEALLNKSEKQLKGIITSIKAKEKVILPLGLKGRLITKVAYYFYKNGRSTKKFYADDKCISCGNCQSLCPSKAIEIIDGKPSWVKSQCVQCLACIHRCPVEAIQYGGGTSARKRYVHPSLK